MRYTVKAVADLAGISVRALHHYDHIGLLRPETVSEAGYRLYSERDLERLQQALFFRELGLRLDEIKEILDDPGFDRTRALASHRELLIERRERLDRLIASVDRTLAAMEEGTAMDYHAMFDGFDESKIREHMDTYRDEARERYGAEVVEESERRVNAMSRHDWEAISAESGEINQALADLMYERDPADPDVQEQVGRWFALINRNFYECTPEIFRNLGDLYVNDERFTAHYDRVHPGLAAFLRDAMHAYADRLIAERD
jgi:MerR family transcriptional regulator, multidrug-efflux activator